jgi:hypothetical protein
MWPDLGRDTDDPVDGWRKVMMIQGFDVGTFT